MPKNFGELSEPEILALAIFLEEEDSRIYGEFARRLRDSFPKTAQLLDQMRAEENEHRTQLLELFRSRFGDHVPLVRRTDVKGFVTRPATWLAATLGPQAVRRAIQDIEEDTRRFYALAIAQVTDISTRKLLGDLANAELEHAGTAALLEERSLTADALQEEADTQRRAFVLRYVQPALAGLMDGSVSTLAPLFAVEFVTHQSWDAFRVCLAASVGAGISMAFAEALSDDGSITGRGSPLVRGTITGAMTAVGGLGHTVPYLIDDVQLATRVAIAVVVAELAVISWVRQHFMETPLLHAVLQVMLGGALVFVAGIIIGQS